MEVLLRMSFLLLLLATSSSAFGQSSDVTPPTFGSWTSHFAVTNLVLVHGNTNDEASAACEAKNIGTEAIARSWLPTGINWLLPQPGSNETIRLCMQQERVTTLAKGTADRLVLTRITLVNKKATTPMPTTSADCPPSMTQLNLDSNSSAAVLPAWSVIICTQFASAADAISRRNYVSDITVTKERSYNNQFSGWTTLPTTVQLSADQVSAPFPLAGVFLSFRRPVLPIVDLKLLPGISPLEVVQSCSSLKASGSPPSFWEAAAIDGFVTSSTTAGKVSVLCLKRFVVDGSSSADTLVISDVASVSAQDCSGVQSQQVSVQLTDSMYLCAKFEPLGSLGGSFIGDVALVQSPNAGFDPQLLSGEWTAFSADVNSNAQHEPKSAAAFVYSRKAFSSNAVGPQTLASLLYNATDEHLRDSKPPLRVSEVCTTDVGSSKSVMKFKIVQIADLHLSGDDAVPCSAPPQGMDPSQCKESLMLSFIDQVLKLEAPNFVVFTGDTIEVPPGREVNQHALDLATQAVEQAKIPWALVFGNHDDGGGISREELFEMISQKPHSYMQRGPSHVDGVGNYELNVLGPQDSKCENWLFQDSVLLRMYFLDSHSGVDPLRYPSSKSPYDWIKPSQVTYYRQLSNSHRGQKDASTVPALMFFHIPIPEFDVGSNALRVGTKQEHVSTSDVNANLFSTLVEQQDVKAVFVGHDHVNEYCYKRQGIQLCYGGGVGMGIAYGDPAFARRVRVIEWTQRSDGQRTVRSWKRHFGAADKIKSVEVLYAENMFRQELI